VGSSRLGSSIRWWRSIWRSSPGSECVGVVVRQIVDSGAGSLRLDRQDLGVVSDTHDPDGVSSIAPRSFLRDGVRRVVREVPRSSAGCAVGRSSPGWQLGRLAPWGPW
jgi:hypothetical protein